MLLLIPFFFFIFLLPLLSYADSPANTSKSITSGLSSGNSIIDSAKKNSDTIEVLAAEGAAGAGVVAAAAAFAVNSAKKSKAAAPEFLGNSSSSTGKKQENKKTKSSKESAKAKKEASSKGSKKVLPTPPVPAKPEKAVSSAAGRNQLPPPPPPLSEHDIKATPFMEHSELPPPPPPLSQTSQSGPSELPAAHAKESAKAKKEVKPLTKSKKALPAPPVPAKPEKAVSSATKPMFRPNELPPPPPPLSASETGTTPFMEHSELPPPPLPPRDNPLQNKDESTVHTEPAKTIPLPPPLPPRDNPAQSVEKAKTTQNKKELLPKNEGARAALMDQIVKKHELKPVNKSATAASPAVATSSPVTGIAGSLMHTAEKFRKMNAHQEHEEEDNSEWEDEQKSSETHKQEATLNGVKSEQTPTSVEQKSSQEGRGAEKPKSSEKNREAENPRGEFLKSIEKGVSLRKTEVSAPKAEKPINPMVKAMEARRRALVGEESESSFKTEKNSHNTEHSSVNHTERPKILVHERMKV